MEIKQVLAEVDTYFHKQEIRELLKSKGEWISFANALDFDDWDGDSDDYSERYYAQLEQVEEK